MHKTHSRLPRPPASPGRPVATPKKRRNRKRRDWNKIIRRACGVVLLAEMGMLLFANPHLQVTKVRINGLQTLSTAQVFEEARVPARTNIFWMALHEPFTARLTRDPVIDHVTRTVQLPRTLVLNVTERRAFAVLISADALGSPAYWVLDSKGVPFRVFDAPPRGLPLLEWPGAPPAGLALGKRLADSRLGEAYTLIRLARGKANLTVLKIKVDQNANLCLNSTDNLQIKLGQPDALPQKLALAQAVVNWRGGDLARRASSIDVSCPQQPVMTARAGRGDNPESDGSPNVYGH